jgi:hypothetical protein
MRKKGTAQTILGRETGTVDGVRSSADTFLGGKQLIGDTVLVSTSTVGLDGRVVVVPD